MVTKYRRRIFKERKWTDEQRTEFVMLAIAIGLSVLAIFFSPRAQAADAALKRAILMCESSNRHYDFKTKRVRYGDDGVSRGIAQFRKETFYEQVAVAKNAGTWPFGKPRWFSKEQQLWLLNDMLDRGLGARWTCYRKLKGVGK